MEQSLSTLDLPEDNIVDIDLGGEYLRQNWKSILPEWANRPPFYVINNGVPQVVCGRHRDAWEAFADRDRFSVVVPKAPGNERFDLFMGTRDVAHMDGEEHDRVRSLIAPAFAPAAVRKMDHAIVATIDGIIDEILAQGDTFEAMSQFCSHLISRIVLDGMFDMKAAHKRTFMRMHEAFALTISIKPGDPFPTEYVDAFNAARDVIYEIIAERRAVPGTDVISALATARNDDGQALSDDELFSNIFAVSAASLGTTANAVGAALIVLCAHQDQFDILRRDPKLIPQAVEECLRFGVGMVSFTRFATCDTEIGGTKIWKDMPIHISRQAADFDPSEYEDPLRFDVHRNPKRILAFGVGPHHCMGARLGRQIMQRSLEAMISRLPHLRFAEPDFEPAYCGMFGELKPKSIPLRFG